MIAKRVPLKKNEHGKPRHSDSFRRLGEYIAAARETGEKLDDLWIVNCEAGETAEELKLALAEVDATRDMKPDVKDRTYHLVVSFRPGDREKLRPEDLREIERTYAAALGFDEHQRVAGTHVNTDHYHMHIAFNRVHPQTFKLHNPHRDFFALARASREIERKFALAVDRGPGERTKPSAKARDFEAKTWRRSFESFVAEHKAEILKGLGAAQSWEEAHRALAEHGLGIKPRGAGLVIHRLDGDETMKATSLDRSCSMKALTDRLGPYTRPSLDRPSPPVKETPGETPKETYRAKPLTSHPGQTPLWETFEKGRGGCGFIARNFPSARSWRDFLLADAHRDALAMAILITHKELLRALTSSSSLSEAPRSLTPALQRWFRDLPWEPPSGHFPGHVPGAGLKVDGHGKVLFPLRDREGRTWAILAVDRDGRTTTIGDPRGAPALRHTLDRKRVLSAEWGGPILVTTDPGLAVRLQKETGAPVVLAATAAAIGAVAAETRHAHREAHVVVVDKDRGVSAETAIETAREWWKASRHESAPRYVGPTATVLSLKTEEKPKAASLDLPSSVTFDDDALARHVRRTAKDRTAFVERLREVMVDSDLLTVSIDAEDGRRVFTSKRAATTEAALLDTADALRASTVHALSPDAARTAVEAFNARREREAGYRLGRDQERAVEALLTGADVGLVVGVAGAGKSTALEAAKEGWLSMGYAVHGAALAGIATDGLTRVGIESRTLASWERTFRREADLRAMLSTGAVSTTLRDDLVRAVDRRIERDRKAGRDAAPPVRIRDDLARIGEAGHAPSAVSVDWAQTWARASLDRMTTIDDRSVLVIDEAGMIGTDQMERVLSETRRRGAKVVLVGDWEQLQPIEDGAAFRAVESRTGHTRLDEVMRQRVDWQREATSDLASGDVLRARKAIKAYAEKGAFVVGVEDGVDRAAAIEVAEEAFGPLDEADRKAIRLVARYVEARHLAGAATAAWLANKSDARVAGEAKEAREDRNEAVAAAVADIERTRRWFDAFGVRGEAVALDLLTAEGEKRDAAEEAAVDRAHELGLTLVPEGGLSFDFRSETRARLVEAWAADVARDPAGSRIMLARTRADVAALNKAGREAMLAAGLLDGPDVVVETDDGPAAFAKGDRVLFKTNDAALGVRNGSLGVVTAINAPNGGAAALAVRLDDGREVRVESELFTGFGHGYAATIHKTQGVTVDRSFALASSGMDRHALYVALSRHRDDVRVFASKLDAATAAGFASRAAESRASGCVSDHLDPREVLRRGGVETPAERRAAMDETPTINAVWRVQTARRREAREGLRAMSAGAAWVMGAFDEGAVSLDDVTRAQAGGGGPSRRKKGRAAERGASEEEGLTR